VYSNLKDIFMGKGGLWKPVFGNYVQADKQPLFSIFRKKIEFHDKEKDGLSKYIR